jgi:hypothetical protein
MSRLIYFIALNDCLSVADDVLDQVRTFGIIMVLMPLVNFFL